MPDSVVSEAAVNSLVSSGGWKLFSVVPIWLAVLVSVLFGYYMYISWSFGVFKRLGIPGPSPLPILGTSLPMLKLGIVQHDMEMRKYGKVVGTFQGSMPLLLIYDVDIIKQMAVREFSNFQNRIVPPGVAYPVRKMLHMLKNEEWKRVRGVLSPTFSSVKLKKMSDQIRRCSETLLKNLTNRYNKGEAFDLQKLCSAFTMDVIASTAFNIEIDSHNDPNNQFVQMGIKAFDAQLASFAMIIYFFFPSLARPLRKLGLSIVPNDVTSFFVKVLNQAMDQRLKGDQENANDFLQLMVNKYDEKEDDENYSKKVSSGDWKSRGLSREEILAQGLLFFLAGFDTTANTLSLLSYSLATNPDCQEKLIKEIDSVMKDHETVDYDVVKKMPYLDMCISETLRLYPSGIRTDRIAEEDITLNGVFIPKGMKIGIPIYAVHMDPEVWPNPKQFNPERFTAEEKETRDPYNYLPFGFGQRNCVGMRLAMTELKISAVTILQKFKFVTCPETEIPLQLNKISMKGVNGIMLKLEKRQP